MLAVKPQRGVSLGPQRNIIRRKLKALGVKKSMPGGVLFIQRLGGAINLNIHAHAIFLDGGYENAEDGAPPKYHSISDHFTQDDVAWAVRKIAERSIKRMRKLGVLDDEGYSKNPDEVDGIGLCDVASVKNMIAYGERAGKKVRRLYMKIDPTAEVTSSGHLGAELHGFNLKADRVVKSHQRWKLARLVRYVARPPVANDRLTLSEDGGTVTYTMKTVV